MKDIKVERFKDTMWISDEINSFLEENDAEYVDMKYIGELGVLLVYREVENKPERKPYEKYPENVEEEIKNGKQNFFPQDQSRPGRLGQDG